MNFKVIFISTLVYIQLFVVGISSISAQSVYKKELYEINFPIPDPSQFKTKEIALIDSFINSYIPPKNFQKDMIRFAKDDSVNSRIKFDVIFTGSSSFTQWKSLVADMAPVPVLNRGFGGSRILDLVYFSKNYLYKLQPKLIFVYVENDITLPSSSQIKLLFRYLEQVYHSNVPKTKIIFCGLKKSISRKTHWTKVDEVNTYLKSSMSQRKYCDYLEMNTALLNKSGLPSGEFFLPDSLHLNANGYLKWNEIVKPRLQKEYNLIKR